MQEDNAGREAWQLESVIGSRVLLGVGLLLLLLGSAFFVKLSNDHQWVPPALRILCGLAAGCMLMLGGAWRLRVRPTLVAEGVTGLGASILYLSLWGAFGPFQLIDAPLAFAAMIAVSAALAAIAWVCRSENVALAGLIGGAATPMLLVGSGFDRLSLAAYLVVLFGVMLALAVGAGFRRVEVAAFVAALLYAPAFAPAPDHVPSWTRMQSVTVASLLFAEFALALFFMARRAANVDHFRLGLLIAEVVSYLGVLEIEFAGNAHDLAAFDLALAFTLLAAVALRAPRALRLTYAALAVVVLTRAVEAWAGLHALTVMLSTEGAALVFIGTQTANPKVRMVGIVLLSLGVIGACGHLVFDHESVVLLNERTAAALVTAAALLVAAIQLRAPGLQIGTALLPIIAFSADIVDQTTLYGAWTSTTQTALSVVWGLWAALLVALGFRAGTAVRYLGIMLFITTIVKVFVIDLSTVDVTGRVISCLLLGAVLVAVAGGYQLVALRRSRGA